MTTGAQDKDNARDSRAEFIDLDMSQERVSRLWNRISTELDMQPPRNTTALGGWFSRLSDLPRSRFAIATAFTLSAIAVGSALFTIGPFSDWGTKDTTAPLAALENATLKTGSDRMAVDLQDGSHVELDANSQLTVQKQEAAELRLKLDTGKVECDVAHNPKRQFYVHAAGVIVRVTGTRFNVNVATEYTPSGAAEHQVEVGVSRGSVEIQRVDGTMPVRKLSAGQTWSMRLSDEINGALPSTAEAAEPDVPVEAKPTFRATLPKSEPTEEPAEAPDDARTLLEKGRQARRQGDPRAAASAYHSLLSQFPDDSRSGLAAFELGRLRMDRLGDLNGAVSALNQAVRLAPGSAFREDAMARLVEAYQRLGQNSACTSAQQQYLRSFPAGVHAATVRSRCAR